MRRLLTSVLPPTPLWRKEHTLGWNSERRVWEPESVQSTGEKCLDPPTHLVPLPATDRDRMGYGQDEGSWRREEHNSSLCGFLLLSQKAPCGVNFRHMFGRKDSLHRIRRALRDPETLSNSERQRHPVSQRQTLRGSTLV